MQFLIVRNFYSLCDIAAYDGCPFQIELVLREHSEPHLGLRQRPFARGQREVALLLPPFGQQEHIAEDLTLACPSQHGFMTISRLSPVVYFEATHQYFCCCHVRLHSYKYKYLSNSTSAEAVMYPFLSKLESRPCCKRSSSAAADGRP